MKMRKIPKIQLISFLHFFLWSTYFTYFWSHSLWFNKMGDLVAGQINIWGDWAAHFTMGSFLANYPQAINHSPFIINAKFSYPFLTNLISAWLIKAQVPFFLTFVIPSFLGSIAIVICLYFFYKTVFKSTAIAILASNFFLLNGGIGFWYFVKNNFFQPNFFKTLSSPIEQYTRVDNLGIKWINVIDSMIIPQRAFNLGFPLALMALSLIFPLFFNKKKPSKKNVSLLTIAGLLIGLLPIIHTHSFLAVVIIISLWSLYLILAPIQLPTKNIFTWALQKNQFSIKQEAIKIWSHFYPLLIVLISSLMIATPLFLSFFYRQVSQHFFKYYPGWLAPEYHLNWLIFWWRNWTVFPLLAFVAWIYQLIKKKKHRLQIFLIWSPFFLLFALANLILFQPFAWDNTKIISWASLGFSGLNAWFIYQLWQKKYRYLWLKKMIRLLLITLIIFMTMSGINDVYYQLLTQKHNYIMYSTEEISLSNWVKANTDKQAIWLTGTNHNHWLFNLTGRQAVMTFPGWLWTHGYNYTQTEVDVRMMYQNPEISGQLFKKYNIDYIVVGPQEKADLGAQPQNFPVNASIIHQTQNYRIYQLSK